MTSQPWRWWPGLLVPLVLCALALHVRTAAIEHDVGDRVAASLAHEGFDWITVASAGGRDVALSGMAPSDILQAAGAKLAEITYGVRRIDGAKLALLPEASPYEWRVSRRENRLVMAGHVPSVEVQRQLGEQLGRTFAKAALVDRVTPARGAPTGFETAARLAVSQLSLLSEGEVSLDGTAMTIAGQAQDFASLDALAAVSRQLPVGFGLAKFSVLPPVAKPFRWRAELRAGNVTLSGFVPSQGEQAALVARAREVFAGSALGDESRPAGGAPEGLDFDGAARFAFGALALMQAGAAVLTDNTLTLSGRATDSARSTRLAALLKGPLPRGMTLEGDAVSLVQPAPAPEKAPEKPAPAAPTPTVSVSPRPTPAAPARPQGYAWSASLQDGKLALAGHFPDDVSQAEMRQRLAQLFPGFVIEDGLTRATGAPDRFMDALLAGLPALARLDRGELSTDGQNLSLTGEALLAAGRDAAEKAVTGALPEGWQGSARLVVAAPAPVVTPAACRERIAGLLSRGRIAFAGGEATIRPDSFGLLDRLASLVRQCPKATIEVDGHTDGDGSAAFLQDLSERRAFAVVDYLIRTGLIESARLKAVGFGATRPLAANDTPAGRARNRRIEIVVR